MQPVVQSPCNEGEFRTTCWYWTAASAKGRSGRSASAQLSLNLDGPQAGVGIGPWKPATSKLTKPVEQGTQRDPEQIAQNCALQRGRSRAVGHLYFPRKR